MERLCLAWERGTNQNTRRRQTRPWLRAAFRNWTSPSLRRSYQRQDWSGAVDQVKNPRASARTRGASFQQFMLYLWRNSGLWNGRREVPNHFKFDIYIQMTVSSDAGARWTLFDDQTIFESLSNMSWSCKISQKSIRLWGPYFYDILWSCKSKG